MLPEPKPSLQAQPLQGELDKIRLTIEKIKTGGWRIPPKGDPFWKKVLEFNKELEMVARGK